VLKPLVAERQVTFDIIKTEISHPETYDVFNAPETVLNERIPLHRHIEVIVKAGFDLSLSIRTGQRFLFVKKRKLLNT
jgi:hypothetical protein